MPRNETGIRHAALLLRPILRSGDGEMSLEQQNDYLKSVRNGTPEIDAHLDKMLLMEINQLRGGLTSAQNLHVRLKDTLTELEKEHKISEDDYHRYHKEIQELTDESITKLDTIMSSKEKEILEF